MLWRAEDDCMEEERRKMEKEKEKKVKGEKKHTLTHSLSLEYSSSVMDGASPGRALFCSLGSSIPIPLNRRAGNPEVVGDGATAARLAKLLLTKMRKRLSLGVSWAACLDADKSNTPLLIEAGVAS